ncbi:MAG: hypothetical protein FWF47_02390 [Clostridia bacterium]|nr:hypothetical protein [Clostridia bacterium]
MTEKGMAEYLPVNGFYTDAQKRRFRETAPKRRSCRRFSGPPSIAQWSALCYAAQRCCIKGVRMVLGMCDPSFFRHSTLQPSIFTGVSRFAALIADTRCPNHTLLAGISGEAFVLTAADNGIGTCWVTHSYRQKDCPVTLEPYEKLLCVIALGCADREEEARAEPRKRRPIERFARNGSVTGWPEWALQIARAVREAPSYANGQPWQLSWAGNSLFFYGTDRYILENGIAVLHAEAALDTRHEWTAGGNERSLITRVTLYHDDAFP